MVAALQIRPLSPRLCPALGWLEFVQTHNAQWPKATGDDSSGSTNCEGLCLDNNLIMRGQLKGLFHGKNEMACLGSFRGILFI